jgi:hypothetical protein
MKLELKHLARQSISTAFVLLCTVYAHAEGASVHVNASFDLSVNCDQPKQLSDVPVHGDIKGVLNSDRTGAIDLTLAAITTNTIHFDGKLGGKPQSVPGGTATLHILSGNRLQGIWGLPNDNIIATITVTGQTCEAGLDFKLKYGNKQYSLFDGANFYFCSRPKLVQKTCSVS